MPHHLFSPHCPPELQQALSTSTQSVFECLHIQQTLQTTAKKCTVALCRGPGGLLCVVKSYHKTHLDEDELQQVALEVQLHQELGQGSCVVPFWAAIDEGQQLHILTPFCDQGDLRSMLSHGPLSEATVRDRVVVPLLQALQELHAKGFVHRDVKPDNVFLAGGSALLADFSLALGPLPPDHPNGSSTPASPALQHLLHQQQQQQRGPFAAAGCGCSSDSSGSLTPTSTSSLSDLEPCSAGSESELLGSSASLSDGSSSFSRSHSLVGAAAAAAAERRSLSPDMSLCSHAGGTPAYCAPEVVLAAFNSLPMFATLGPQNDIWSLGVLAAECLLGQHPLGDAAASGGAAVMRSISSSQPLPLSQLPVSPQCKDWLAAALAKDPRQRWSARRLLQHPWVAEAAAGPSQQQQQQQQGAASAACAGGVDRDGGASGHDAGSWDQSCWAVARDKQQRWGGAAPQHHACVPPWVEDDWVTGLGRLSSQQQQRNAGDSCSSRDVMRDSKQQQTQQCHAHGMTSWED